jgi:competence protein ComEC
MMFKKAALFMISFLAAIFISSAFEVHISYPVILLLLVCSGILLLFSQTSIRVQIALVCLGIALGLLRFDGLSVSEKDTSLHFFAEHNHPITLVGYIAERPDIRDTRTDFIFETSALSLDNTQHIPIHTRILVQAEPYGDYQYGQELIIHGVPQVPESFETDTGRIFDYDTYLYKDDIFYTMRYVDIQPTGVMVEVPFIKKSLYSLKDTLIEHIRRYIPRPASGLLAGVLFGEKAALDTDTLEKFRTVGLMHIVVLSGYNVAIVIYAIMYFLRRIPLGIRSVLAIIGILAFMILTGAGPTVIRASIMGGFIIVSKFIGERYDIHKALLIAGFIMVCINPKILYFDISFQLSFLATYGLLVFSPWLEQKLVWVPSFLLLRESAVATISAQIMVLPLILYSIGEFSIISIVVNMLVLFAVPLAMLLGFITSIFGWAHYIASILSYPTALILEYILYIVDIFAAFSFSVITFPAFHWVFMVLMYLVIGFFAYGIHRLHPQK